MQSEQLHKARSVLKDKLGGSTFEFGEFVKEASNPRFLAHQTATKNPSQKLKKGREGSAGVRDSSGLLDSMLCSLPDQELKDNIIMGFNEKRMLEQMKLR